MEDASQLMLDYAATMRCDPGRGARRDWDRGFRIAHMGDTNAPMVIGTLGAVEMALKALESRMAPVA